MKKFQIPHYYRSEIISKIKDTRNADAKKKDFTPTRLNFGPVEFFIARHFGFCFGVENAIDIAYKTIDENPGKRIFILSEMIHNPGVNDDLEKKGVKFISTSYGEQLIDWSELTSDDIVIIPAFGTTVETENMLAEKGLDIQKYNTTCPFVKRVWKRADDLARMNATVIIHGKYKHEETKATFSHSVQSAHSVVVRDEKEAGLLCKIIRGEIEQEKFYELFENKFSEGFDVEKHLTKIGVVNQTTMLATETENIASCLKNSMVAKYGEENIDDHFCDTSETLCYATHNNQTSTNSLLNLDADLAIVVGGYNSSNTSHIAELLEQKFNMYFVSGADRIISQDEIKHFDYSKKEEVITKDFLPSKENVKIILTSGASCPDAVVEDVLVKILSYFENTKSVEEIIGELN